MRHPRVHAHAAPDKVAYHMAGSGASLTFMELERRANQGAHAFRALGLMPGDHIAFFIENRLEFLEICWAAQRSGIVFTAISRYLQAEEAAYIVRDCGAGLFIGSHAHAGVCEAIRTHIADDVHCFMVGGSANRFRNWEAFAAPMPETPIADESAGVSMLYSSGTTGRPKGILRKHPGPSLDSLSPVLVRVCEDLGKMGPQSVYLSPAPLYHSAPLGAAMVAAALGATTVILEKFDEERFLSAIESHRVTHTQVVPTMFVRLLKLPQADRARHDVSSLTTAIHVAAPCPQDIKRKMMDWWGPILLEYYAGTEGNGVCAATAGEWLSHPGTVGRSLIGQVRILDEDGSELPRGEVGDVYFDSGLEFSYHNDSTKTDEAFKAPGCSTLGDIGWMDEDGFVYLTDRRAYTIISGGVNVYPQETEDVLVSHPAVFDVAVFGIPNDDLGEEVKAVVQPIDDDAGGPELEAELIAFCKSRLSGIKTPKSIDFRNQLPRTPTGKLIKRHLKAEYWPDAASK